MTLIKPPKAWQKLAPDSIEAWLVSDDPREQRLADEALAQLGVETASLYLQRLLVLEQDTILKRIRYAATMCMVLFVLLFITYFITKNLWFYLGTVAGSMIVCLGTIPLQQTTTVLQTRIVEWVIAKRDVRFIGVLLKSLQAVPSTVINNSVRGEHLPYMMEQITTDTRNLVPDEFWKLFTQSLEATAKQKDIRYIPTEQAFALAHIRICGNTRYEPALPALRMIAEREATTVQVRELKELAARYVAQWDSAPTANVSLTALQAETTLNPLRLTVR